MTFYTLCALNQIQAVECYRAHGYDTIYSREFAIWLHASFYAQSLP